MAEGIRNQAEQIQKGGEYMLIDRMYVDVVRIDEVSVSDGEGGFITEYVEGAPFTAAIAFDGSVSTAIAQKNGAKGSYKITTPYNAKLKYGDIIKRVEDGKMFLITGKENSTPRVATFSFNVVQAEEWEKPND